MKISSVLIGATFAALSVATTAGANTIYSNPYVFGVNADCSFSTVCAASAGRGDDFAAQEFTLTSAAVVTSASFTMVDFGGAQVTDVNWGFLLADGAGGLPGTILSAGTDSVTSSSNLGTDFGGSVDQEFFGVGPQALGPGTYYFAIQGVSTAFATYLGYGAAASGAAETHDGGVTWASTYEGFPSVAVALYGAGGGGVPEPATWALMMVGLGGLGVALRGRARKALASA